MTTDEYYYLLKVAKDRNNWVPELFEKFKQACVENKPCIFNELRRVMKLEEYESFDIEYSEYFRPGTKELRECRDKEEKRKELIEWKRKILQLNQTDIQMMTQKQLMSFMKIWKSIREAESDGLL